MTIITETTIADKIIFKVDHSRASESEMIVSIEELKQRIIAKNKKIMILTVFTDKSYATPRFMRAAESAAISVLPLIDKQAIVGLNFTKQLILKGYNLLLKRNIPHFDSEEEAMAFLLNENTSDRI